MINHPEFEGGDNSLRGSEVIDKSGWAVRPMGGKTAEYVGIWTSPSSGLVDTVMVCIALNSLLYTRQSVVVLGRTVTDRPEEQMLELLNTIAERAGYRAEFGPMAGVSRDLAVMCEDMPKPDDVREFLAANTSESQGGMLPWTLSGCVPYMCAGGDVERGKVLVGTLDPEHMLRTELSLNL